MDAIKTSREIGFFLAGDNLMPVLDSNEVRVKVGDMMPLPDESFQGKTDRAADWLTQFGKTKYLFFSPEIALIERLPACKDKTESIILIPSDMDEEIYGRIQDNLPSNMKVNLLKEPFFPKEFFPSNGIIVVSGYLAGGRLMVLPETYRMINHYSDFMGKMVFLPYVILSDSIRYSSWIEAEPGKFNEIWGDESWEM